MANKVTTEWEDIHVRLGNYLPTQEKSETMAELENITLNVIENFDPLKSKTDEQIKEMVLEDEEDEFIKEYQQKRLNELKEFSKKTKFGTLIEIRRQDFVTEVNNAPSEVYVVLGLYNDSVESSLLLCKSLEFLANKFPLVKFLKIVANNCIENIREYDIPSLIIYYGGKLLKQYIPAAMVLGKDMSWKSKLLI